MFSYVIFGALFEKFIFRDGDSGHFGFAPLAKNASIFYRDTGAKSVLIGP